jgi:hypothetical protein
MKRTCMSAHVKRPGAAADVRQRHGLGAGHVGRRSWSRKANAKRTGKPPAVYRMPLPFNKHVPCPLLCFKDLLPPQILGPCSLAPVTALALYIPGVVPPRAVFTTPIGALVYTPGSGAGCYPPQAVLTKPVTALSIHIAAFFHQWTS